jgi:hypothetical protein
LLVEFINRGQESLGQAEGVRQFVAAAEGGPGILKAFTIEKPWGGWTMSAA